MDAHDRCCSCRAKFHQILHPLSWEGNKFNYKKYSLLKKKGVRLDHGASQEALVVKNPPVKRYKRPGFNPWAGTISWRREWQFTPIFLSGEFHGLRSLAGYSPPGPAESWQINIHLIWFSKKSHSSEKGYFIRNIWKKKPRKYTFVCFTDTHYVHRD